jgi:hypothetical protein
MLDSIRRSTSRTEIGGMMWRILSAVFLLLSSPVSTFSQAVNNRTNTSSRVDSEKRELQSAMAINVVTDCGAVGDGVTDDWAAIQACLTNHPGKTIFFPKMRTVPCVSGAGGMCVGSVDYYVGKTLKLSGNGQALVGTTPSRWPGGAVQIKFSPTMNTPGIWVPDNVYSGYVANLFLNGQRCWSSTDLTTFDKPASVTGLGPDGVLLTGGEPSIDGVTAYCFGRHGLAVLGDNAEGEPFPGQPDFWSIRNSFAYANRGYGLYVTGGDSNAGESIALKTTGNQLGGIYDHSVLGNTHISPASHVDNRNPVRAGPTQPVGLISVSNGRCELTTQAALANGLSRVNTWITVRGTSGGHGFDGTYRVSAFNGRTLSYSCPSSGGPIAGGVVGTASSQDVYLAYNASGIKTGAYLGVGGSSETVWLNPYCESNSNAPNFGPSSIVIGRFCEVNVIGDRTWTSWGAGPGWGSTMRVGQGLTLDNASDVMNWLSITAGRTTEQYKGIRFLGLKQTPYWTLGQYKDSYFFIQDAQSKGFNSITLNKGGATEISAPNNAVVRLGRGSTGGVQVIGGTHFLAGATEVAGVDTAGKGTFTGLCLSAKICWNSGKGAPAPGTCSRDKGGSLYTRTDGGPTTTLYVCDGSSGVWTAK